jgi:hypothetical protein
VWTIQRGDNSLPYRDSNSDPLSFSPQAVAIPTELPRLASHGQRNHISIPRHFRRCHSSEAHSPATETFRRVKRRLRIRGDILPLRHVHHVLLNWAQGPVCIYLSVQNVLTGGKRIRWVGIATCYRLNCQGVWVRVSVWSRMFSFPRPLDRSWGPSTEGSFPTETHPGREAHHSPTTSAEVKNMWIYTSTPPYVLVAECLISKAQGQIYLFTWNIQTGSVSNQSVQETLQNGDFVFLRMLKRRCCNFPMTMWWSRHCHDDDDDDDEDDPQISFKLSTITNISEKPLKLHGLSPRANYTDLATAVRETPFFIIFWPH